MTHHRWYVVAALFSAAFLTIADRVCISAAKTDMARDLNLSDMTFGAVFGAFALGYAILMVPSGWFADRFGPRKFMALIVGLWSLFTLWTGLVHATAVLIAVRFLFGLAEAGCFPTAARAMYNWLPIRERGLALGLLNTGSRLGAAVGLAVLSLSIAKLGWRLTFALLGSTGFAWAALWHGWFRDDPAQKRAVSTAELEHIRAGRPEARPIRSGETHWRLLLCPNTSLILTQYFASNFAFFICFSWLLPYLRSRFALAATEAGLYASVPLYCGACATWISGLTIDAIYRRGRWRLSRRLPAMFGFSLASVMLVAAASMASPASFIACFALATFGLDLTLSPSWTTCSDIGGRLTGTLSGAMNTMGSVGSFVSSLAFPWLLGLTGGIQTYFYMAAALNVVAVLCWWRIRPDRPLSPMT
ncbi:MAG: MFS transporter [Acidobacteriota bacterium]